MNEFDLANSTGAHVGPADKRLVGANGMYSVWVQIDPTYNSSFFAWGKCL